MQRLTFYFASVFRWDQHIQQKAQERTTLSGFVFQSNRSQLYNICSGSTLQIVNDTAEKNLPAVSFTSYIPIFSHEHNYSTNSTQISHQTPNHQTIYTKPAKRSQSLRDADHGGGSRGLQAGALHHPTHLAHLLVLPLHRQGVTVFAMAVVRSLGALVETVAGDEVVVGHAGGLHEGVDHRRADATEAPPHQVLADGLGLRRPQRHLPRGTVPADHRLVVQKAPVVFVKRSELLYDLQT